MKKKILVLSNNCSGLVCFRKEVFESLIDDNDIITISAPSDESSSILIKMGCMILPTAFKRHGTNPFADLILMLRYYHIIRKLRPDVVLTYTIKPNLYGGMACRLSHTPQIANITGLGIATEESGILRTITSVLYKIGLKKAKKVFFQNQENLDFCERHQLVKAPTALIPGSGVNLSRFNLLPYPQEEDTSRFIFISRIQRRKGIEQYLDAAKVIKSKYPNTEFHILGSCENNKYISKLNTLSKEGIINYHGSVSDIRPFLSYTHCTVHPSFYPEGMSNVLLESCASGRPVITTDRSGCKEIVDEGKNGFIVRQQNTYDLIEAIERFILLPYQEKIGMGLYARQKMEKEFSRQIVIQAYKDEIDKI